MVLLSKSVMITKSSIACSMLTISSTSRFISSIRLSREASIELCQEESLKLLSLKS